MDRFKLQQCFQALTGLSDEEMPSRQPLLELAAKRVEQRLKPSVDAAQEESVLLLLAAADAQYLDALTSSTPGGSGWAVKVGDVSVSEQKQTRLNEALRLREEVRALAAPLLTDDHFVFRQT